MGRLIDADALLNRMKNDPLFDLVERYGVSGVIKAQPTVDAVPVRHGKWIASETNGDNMGRMIENKIKRFIDHYKDDAVETQYKAGIVNKYLNGFIIAYEQLGAQETFSVGQPVYDEDGNIMGYLGIGLFDSLDYLTEGQQRIPCEHWTVCLPTKYCVEGKRVYTYWQKGKKNER